MRSHLSSLLPRIIRAGLRAPLRYRVVAVGLDSRNRPISIRTNIPRLVNRSWHAEERVLHSTPLTLSYILIARVGANGELLPIEPCSVCQRLADKRGVQIRYL